MGRFFDSSSGRDALEFVVGSGQVIPGLNAMQPGSSVGEKQKVQIKCDQAYGTINPAMRQAIPREGIPEDIRLDIGMKLQMQTANGRTLPVKVIGLQEARSLRMPITHWLVCISRLSSKS